MEGAVGVEVCAGRALGEVEVGLEGGEGVVRWNARGVGVVVDRRLGNVVESGHLRERPFLWAAVRGCLYSNGILVGERFAIAAGGRWSSGCRSESDDAKYLLPEGSFTRRAAKLSRRSRHTQSLITS